MNANDFYVYRLVDRHAPVGPGQSVFYIGKGRGQRFADHFDEARCAAAVRDRLQAERDLASGPEDAATKSKIDVINDLLARPGSIRVDIIGRDLTEQTALAIETAAIDVIGIEHLTNLVRGHHSQCQPLRALQISEEAQDVPLTDPAIVVVVSGVWAPGDCIEGLSALDEQAVWENARQRWRLSPAVRRVIDRRAAAGEPVRLLAVHARRLSGPGSSASVLGGVVMGEWYIHGTEPCDEHFWRFVAHGTPAPPRYGHKRLLTADGTARFHANQGTVHSSAFRDLLASPDA
jgi:hypothetical protein